MKKEKVHMILDSASGAMWDQIKNDKKNTNNNKQKKVNRKSTKMYCNASAHSKTTDDISTNLKR